MEGAEKHPKKIINDFPIISDWLSLNLLRAVGGPEVSDKTNSVDSSSWKKRRREVGGVERTGTRSWYCQDHLESSGLRLWTGNKSIGVSNTP